MNHLLFNLITIQRLTALPFMKETGLWREWQLASLKWRIHLRSREVEQNILTEQKEGDTQEKRDTRQEKRSWRLV